MENRQFHRLLLRVDITHHLKSAPKVSKSWTKDISRGGICITTCDEPLLVHEIYIMKFSLPDIKKQIKAQGMVVCTRKYIEGIAVFYDNGIEFTKLRKKYRKLIEDYSIGSINL